MTNANVLKPRLKGATSLIGHGLALPLVGISRLGLLVCGLALVDIALLALFVTSLLGIFALPLLGLLSRPRRGRMGRTMARQLRTAAATLTAALLVGGLFLTNALAGALYPSGRGSLAARRSGMCLVLAAFYIWLTLVHHPRTRS